MMAMKENQKIMLKKVNFSKKKWNKYEEK